MKIKTLIIFLVANFTALFLGSLLTSSGVSSDWYAELNKAPWTPPGWVFGAAWTTIMVFFSVYLAFLVEKREPIKEVLILFGVSWVLNVAWNPIFFYFHNVILGLVVITSLSVLIFTMLIRYKSDLGWKSILITPYCVWLCIATSLNLYVYLYN